MTYRTRSHSTAWPPTIWIVGILTILTFLFGLLQLRHRTPPAGTAQQISRKPSPPPIRDGFTRGIALGLFSRDIDYDYGPLIAEIAAQNANSISLFFNMYQRNGTSVDISPRESIEEQEAIISRATRQAHDLGLEVFHFPVVLLSRPKTKQWRGNLAPEDLDVWFSNYRAHMLRLARLASSLDVETFCIGTEYSSLEVHEDRWRSLIRDAREIYEGQIIYSANWDHYRHVKFWDAVDAVGLSGYYELTEDKDASLKELTQAWAVERNRILSWHRDNEIKPPILFTEIGYPNLDGAAIHPWDYTKRGDPDPDEQALCYEAFINAWSEAPNFKGVYFYNWFGYPELDSPGYSPRGKPAADVMSVWFAKPRVAGSALE